MAVEQNELAQKARRIEDGLAEQIAQSPRPVSTIEGIIYSLLKDEGVVVGGRATAHPYVAAVSTKLFTDDRFVLYQGLLEDYLGEKDARLSEEIALDLKRYEDFCQEVHGFVKNYYGKKATYEDFFNTVEEVFYHRLNLPITMGGDRRAVLKSRVLEQLTNRYAGGANAPENYSIDEFVEALERWE